MCFSSSLPHRAVMPGMVMFRRRWSVGSDDLVLPALFLFLLHCIWWVLRFDVFLCECMFLCLSVVRSPLTKLKVWSCIWDGIFTTKKCCLNHGCVICGTMPLPPPPRLVVLSVVLFGLPYGSDQSCSVTLVDHGRGYLGILVSCLICESAIIWLSMRGSILYTQPREAVQYVIYIRLGKTHPHVITDTLYTVEVGSH